MGQVNKAGSCRTCSAAVISGIYAIPVAFPSAKPSIEEPLPFRGLRHVVGARAWTFSPFRCDPLFWSRSRTHALPNVSEFSGRIPCCSQKSAYDCRRCSIRTRAPKLSGFVLSSGFAGLHMALASIHRCTHCVMLSPFIFCW